VSSRHPASGPPPAAARIEQAEPLRLPEVRVEVRQPEPRQVELPALPSAEQTADTGEFVSPFEDELDVPTFLRRRREEEEEPEEEEDRDTPAFLRRSAD